LPYAITFPIEGEGPPPQDVYRILYANLLTWVDAASPELAQALHDRPARKPFTVSALRARKAGGWRWRVTLLEDDLWAPLREGGTRVGALDLNGTKVPVAWHEVRVVHRSYDALLTELKPRSYLRMAFVSPTTFRQGSLDLPLPEPSTIFQSWLSRWNDFSPDHVRLPASLLDTVYKHVGVVAIDHLHTQQHDLGYSRPVGFVGRVTLVITHADRYYQADAWQLNALADYAEFCGTGRKTPYGMGQTRRLRPAERSH
jgi:CRISPR-associated endoribonuclease Cas6